MASKTMTMMVMVVVRNVDEDGSGDGNIIIDDGDDELRLMRQQIQLKHLGLQKKDGKFSQMFLVGVSNEH